jgi:uncharacterized membrane protein
VCVFACVCVFVCVGVGVGVCGVEYERSQTQQLWCLLRYEFVLGVAVYGVWSLMCRCFNKDPDDK